MLKVVLRMWILHIGPIAGAIAVAVLILFILNLV